MNQKISQQEVSQLIATQRAVEDALVEQKTDWKHTAAILITVVTLAVGAVLWATNSHAQIKGWTAEQDFVTKFELTEVMKEHYVKQTEFIIVKEKLEFLKEKHEKLLDTLQVMNDKLDKLGDKRYTRNERQR